jgi:hypothetical protein
MFKLFVILLIVHEPYEPPSTAIVKLSSNPLSDIIDML